MCVGVRTGRGQLLGAREMSHSLRVMRYALRALEGGGPSARAGGLKVTRPVSPQASPALEPLVRAARFLSSRCTHHHITQLSRHASKAAEERGDARDGVGLVPDARGDLGRDDGRGRDVRAALPREELPAAPAGAVHGLADEAPVRC